MTIKLVYGLPLHTAPTHPDFIRPDVLARLSARAEERGYAGIFLTEHPVPSENWRSAGGHDAFDPFVALAAMAMVTKTVRLFTYLTVVPYRNPFLWAKSVATLDRMSEGRVELGMGTGYQKGEFSALGVDFEERNALFDEALEVAKAAWSGEVVSYNGLHFSAKANRSLPTPLQRPHPPFWFGGNASLTLRRIVANDGGWMPLPSSRAASSTLHSPPLETLSDLQGYLDRLGTLADEATKPKPPVIYCLPRKTTTTAQQRLDLVGNLVSMGVEWLSINGEGVNEAEAVEFLDEIADELSLVGPYDGRR
jgi:probable F420-dependent oxidoreductase